MLVCHSGEDSDFAINVLADTLQKQYNYSVTICQINQARGKHFVLVLSIIIDHISFLINPIFCRVFQYFLR